MEAWPNALSNSQQTWRRPSFLGIREQRECSGNELWLRRILYAESWSSRGDRSVLPRVDFEFRADSVSVLVRLSSIPPISRAENCQTSSEENKRQKGQSRPTQTVLFCCGAWPRATGQMFGALFLVLFPCFPALTWPTAALAGESRNNRMISYTLSCAAFSSSCDLSPFPKPSLLSRDLYKYIIFLPSLLRSCPFKESSIDSLLCINSSSSWEHHGPREAHPSRLLGQCAQAVHSDTLYCGAVSLQTSQLSGSYRFFTLSSMMFCH